MALLWEAAFGFDEFVLRTLSVCLPISWWVVNKHICPHFAECSAVFDQKRWLPFPILLVHPILPWVTFCCFPSGKGPHRKTFCRCGRGETKSSGNTDRHQNPRVRTVLSSGKDVSKVYCIRWRGLWKWLKFEHVRRNTQLFISKFWGFGVSPYRRWCLIMGKDIIFN